MDGVLTDRNNHVPAYHATMQPQARLRKPKPLTSHHMFVPMIALWFGALFSLSSLAVRTGLFEQAIVSIGVDRLFPYAAPPLGHTARLLIAALFGLAGAGIGGMLAKVVAGADLAGVRSGNRFNPPSAEHGPVEPSDEYRVRARDAHPDAPARRPISASMELGTADLDGPPTGQRSPEDDFPVQRVPGPWVPRSPGDEVPLEAEPDTPPLPEWFDTTSAENASRGGEPSPAASGPPVAERLAVEVLPPVPASSPPSTGPVLAGAAEEVTDPDYPEAWRNTAERIAQAPPAALGHVELIERLAIALNKRGEPETPAADQSGGQPAGTTTLPPAAGPDAAATIQALREALATLRGA